MVVEILSSPAPPYCSGVPPLIRPRSAALRASSGIRPGFLASRSLTCGKTSLITNSSAVCPISFWSSVRSAGVKMSSAAGDSRRKLPPFAAGLVRTEVAMGDAPCRPSAASEFKHSFEKNAIRKLYMGWLCLCNRTRLWTAGSVGVPAQGSSGKHRRTVADCPASVGCREKRRPSHGASGRTF